MPGIINTGLLITVTGLAGCSSMPRQSSSVPPQQAVIAGYQQLYSTSSYQFSGQFRINQLGFNGNPEMLQAGAELEKQKKAKEKQQLIQRYIDELTADAQSESADDDTASDNISLTPARQEQIRKQAEQEVNALLEDETSIDAAVDAAAQAARDSILLEQESNLELGEKDEPETATSQLRNLKKAKLIEDLMDTYAKRYQMNYQGTLDLRHGKIAFSPEVRYEATNMAGYMRVPLVLDLRQAHLYADLSALSPWLVQVQHDGKYSRFDLSSYKNKVNVKQLLEVLKQTTQASYQLPMAQQFKEVSLSTQERQQGALRKVEFNQPLAHRMADVATFLAFNQNSLKQIVNSKNASAKAFAKDQTADRQTTNNQPDTPLMTADAVSQLLAQDPETYQQLLHKIEEKIDPASSLKQVVLLDNKGRLIESGTVYNVLFKPDHKGQLSMQLSHQLNFSNYGKAEVAFKPNASNWVDAKTNMQDTLFGGLMSIFGKKSLGGDDLLKSFGEDDSANSIDEMDTVEADTGETETDMNKKLIL